MTDDDAFLWLEEVEGAVALQWVRGENARSFALLEGDPRYAAIHRDALAVVTASDRIPYPSFLGDRLANFWQDEAHVRGLWRVTTLASYATAVPDWQVLLDVDTLAAAEGRNWVFHGASVLRPDYRRALVSLSDGGKDASELREFDLATARFVEDGFFLPEGKQSATWLDADTLIVARDWGSGTMTASGYPFILKRLSRDAPLDAAEQLFAGTPEDVSVGAGVLRNPQGQVKGILVNRQVSFFESERYLLSAGGPLRLPLPTRSSFRGFVAGQLVFSLEEEWRIGLSHGRARVARSRSLPCRPRYRRPATDLCPGTARGDRGRRHDPQPSPGDDLSQRPGQRGGVPLRAAGAGSPAHWRCPSTPRSTSSRRASARTARLSTSPGF